MQDLNLARPQEGGYAIYRKNCLHCHGVSGAGDGPTAPFLYPLPRDYRKGIFKFTSTAERCQARTATIFAGRSRTVCTEHRCRRSTPC